MTIKLSRQTERTVLHCSACDRKLGAVHATSAGPVVVTLEYPSEQERAEYELERAELGITDDTPEYPAKLPPAEYVRWFDGSPLTPTPLPADVRCPNHGRVDLDLAAIAAAYDAGHRTAKLALAASAP